jgi:hypothetical protein
LLWVIREENEEAVSSSSVFCLEVFCLLTAEGRMSLEWSCGGGSLGWMHDWNSTGIRLGAFG